MKYYAGIGSRETPADVRRLMAKTASVLSMLGFILRSGGADGADTAFELGADGKTELCLPWDGFNGREGVVCGEEPRLQRIAEQCHPNWRSCTASARAFHTRNVAQVLGPYVDSTPSLFVICWTPWGSGQGGTGQAIRVANLFRIPVFDLGVAKNLELLQALLGRLA